MEIGIKDYKGDTHQLPLTLAAAQAAADGGFKHALARYDAEVVTDPEGPTASQQIYHQLGYGRRGLTVAAAFDATGLQAATTNDGSIAGRLAGQAYLMDAIENKLLSSDYGIMSVFTSQAAVTDSIADTRFDRPVLDLTKAEAGRSRSIAQLSEPASMLTLTTSDRSFKIPGTAIGMEYSDEAAKNVSMNIVTLAMTRQAEVEALERVEQQMLAFLNGDADLGMTALSTVSGAVTTSVSLDSTLTSGNLSQKAWALWFFNNSRKRTITTVITDIAGALAIEKRANRPVVTGDNGTSKRIDVRENILNPTWPDQVNIIVSQDPNWPANTIVGFDKTYGYHLVNSTSIAYSAMSEFAIRRSTKLRIDSGSIAYRLFDDAWSVLTF